MYFALKHYICRKKNSQTRSLRYRQSITLFRRMPMFVRFDDDCIIIKVLLFYNISLLLF